MCGLIRGELDRHAAEESAQPVMFERPSRGPSSGGTHFAAIPKRRIRRYRACRDRPSV